MSCRRASATKSIFSITAKNRSNGPDPKTALREANRGGFSQEPHEPISARDLLAEGPLSLKDLRVASKSYSDPELERWNQLPDELFKIRK
jgi:hypothetical protein